MSELKDHIDVPELPMRFNYHVSSLKPSVLTDCACCCHCVYGVMEYYRRKDKKHERWCVIQNNQVYEDTTCDMFKLDVPSCGCII